MRLAAEHLTERPGSRSDRAFVETVQARVRLGDASDRLPVQEKWSGCRPSGELMEHRIKKSGSSGHVSDTRVTKLALAQVAHRAPENGIYRK